MKENSISGDNRFEIIEKAKEKLLNATNIEDSKEEMKVLTNILFRMWQAGLINEEKLEINKLQKENSIEEDITRVKQRIEDVKEYIEYGLPYSEYLDLENSFDNILLAYKRVLKENEELNLKYYMLYTGEIENLNEQEVKIKSQVIPVQKVKDKIEELDIKITYIESQYTNGGQNCDKNYLSALYQKQVLQELLEKRK